MIKQKKKYFLWYTGLFLILFFLCFGIYLLKYHKSPLRIWDTYDMHYMEFLYLGRWIRAGLTTGKFPVWEPSIGYGADFFLTMSGFVCDPLNWIAIITPSKFAETGFLMMVIAKLYLAGVAFSFFGFHRQHKPYAVLCGAVVYTFCACAYTGLYQSCFINPMYVFPLLIIGTDRLFEGNDSKLYVITLTYCAATYFYVTYMIAILIICYCILKWVFKEKMERTNKSFAIIFARFFVYSLWAAGMAAAVLVPVSMLMLNMGRLNLQRYVPMLYDREFYANMFKGFISTFDMQGRDCKIGFSILALLSVFLLFITGRGKNRQQKIEFLLMSIGLCLPIVGHVMNGFGYIANRWVWAYAFLVSYLVTMELPQMQHLDTAQWYLLILCSATYVFLGYEVFHASGRAFLILSIALLLVSTGSLHLKTLTQKQYEKLAVVVSCVTVVIPALYYYSTRYGNGLGNFIPAGDAMDRAKKNGGLPLLEQIDTSDGTRYNRYGLTTVRNASWIYGVSGTEMYMNLYNDAIDQFHNSMALKTSAYSFGYDGLDRRSELMALLGVSHFFTKAADPYLPVTFDELEAEAYGREGLVQSWKPTEKYGIFTRFTEAVSYEEFEKLSPFNRQELLMKALVAEEDYATTQELKWQSGIEPLNMLITTKGGIQYEENSIDVKESGAQLCVRIPTQKNSEIYLYLDNIQFENGLATGYHIDANGLYVGQCIPRASDSYDGLTYISHMYGGKHNWMLNLGIVSGSINEIRITFGSVGHYDIDGIYVFAKSVDEIEQNMKGLNQKVGSVSFSSNRMQVSVNNEQKEFLFVAVPYSSGWKAYNNGKLTQIIQADVGFMAIRLEPGMHDIEFQYHTPGFTAGVVITFGSVLGYCAYQKTIKPYRKKEEL